MRAAREPLETGCEQRQADEGGREVRVRLRMNEVHFPHPLQLRYSLSNHFSIEQNMLNLAQFVCDQLDVGIRRPSIRRELER